MNAFTGYLLKQRLVGALSEEMSKLAGRGRRRRRKKTNQANKVARRAEAEAKAQAKRRAEAFVRPPMTASSAPSVAEAGFKRTGAEAAETAMKMGKGSKAALLASILAAGGTATALGAKAYKRSRPTPKASAKQKLMAVIKRNPKKSMAAGGGAAAATLAALAANK